MPVPKTYTLIRNAMDEAVENLDIAEKLIHRDDDMGVTSEEHAAISRALGGVHQAIGLIERRWREANDHAR